MVWTAILSKFFLSKKLTAHHWISMLVVATGLAIVSVIESYYDSQTVDAVPAETTQTKILYVGIVLVS